MDLLNVKLSKPDDTDQVNLGNFCVDLGGQQTWTIKNLHFDLSAGFKISGLVARGGTVFDACGECSKVELLTMNYDNIAPTITCPTTTLLEAAVGCTATIPDLTTGVASDNCAGIKSVSQSPAIGTPLVGLGPHVVTFTATDNNGNTATVTCPTAVTVVDTTVR